MPRIDPLEWLSVANLRCPCYEGLTQWHPGTVAPAHVGWYERHFTDSAICEPSVSMHYWDGLRWLTEDGKPHWRQVGDYPAWRGSTRNLQVGQEIVLIRGSRGRCEGPGSERRVRAQLIAATAYNVHAVLLEDDALATCAPKRSGEAGVWHGLSFIE